MLISTKGLFYVVPRLRGLLGRGEKERENLLCFLDPLSLFLPVYKIHVSNIFQNTNKYSMSSYRCLQVCVNLKKELFAY